jgi:hypothetical protein
MIQLKQIDSSTPRVITAVLRAVLLVGAILRVVRRVIIVTRVADGKSANGGSDDVEGGTTETW